MNIKEFLTTAAADTIEEATTKRKAGRKAFVNRIRNGQVQLRHAVSEVPNYKIVDGQLVLMKPEEIRKRKRAAKLSARKRAGKMSQILRKRSISLKKRKARFGA